MATYRYVTSQRMHAKVAHLGYPITACRKRIAWPYRATDTMPADRRICRECVRVATGLGWITSEEADLLLGRTVAETTDPIIGMLIDGASDRQAALRLGISERTVSRRIADAMSAAGAATRFQWGYRLGLAASR